MPDNVREMSCDWLRRDQGAADVQSDNTTLYSDQAGPGRSGPGAQLQQSWSWPLSERERNRWWLSAWSEVTM